MAQVLAVIVKGGIVMIPLLICSLISLALTIERILFLGETEIARGAPRNFDARRAGRIRPKP